jgi:hypothetical protein
MAALSLSGCSGQDTGSGGLPATKYVAVRETYDERFTIIEGNPTHASPMSNPPYPLDIDGSRGMFPEDVSVNRSLKALYVKDQFRYQALNRQTSGREVAGVYSLPYVADADVTLLDVDENGTVHFSFRNESVYLNIGDHWVSPSLSSRVEETNFNTSTTVYADGKASVVVPEHVFFKTRYDAFAMLENLGIVDKSGVKKK